MTATPLLLLHGWGMTPRVWSGLRICLSPRRVIVPALPGHDDRAPAGASLAAWSEALLADMPVRAVVCGWSLGGLIALDLARRHPGRIARLILIGASPSFVNRGESDAPDAWRNGLAADTVRGFTEGFAADPAGVLRRFVALQTLGDTRRRELVAALSRSVTEASPDRLPALADGLRLLAESDLRAGVHEIRQPVRLIHGTGDALMPIGAAEWLASALPDARLDALAHCGHAPFLSRPEEVARLIEHDLAD